MLQNCRSGTIKDRREEEEGERQCQAARGCAVGDHPHSYKANFTSERLKAPFLLPRRRPKIWGTAKADSDKQETNLDPGTQKAAQLHDTVAVTQPPND
eukprot:3216100-Prymnesium_polylepis.1